MTLETIVAVEIEFGMKRNMGQTEVMSIGNEEGSVWRERNWKKQKINQILMKVN